MRIPTDPHLRATCQELLTSESRLDFGRWENEQTVDALLSAVATLATGPGYFLVAGLNAVALEEGVFAIRLRWRHRGGT